MNDQKSKHPIVDDLEMRISHFADGGNVRVEKAVRTYGQPFIAITRPKRYRLGPARQCFSNAGDLALDEKGIYVEGFAMDSDPFCFPHAWITLDGIHAIDVTLKDAVQKYSYFGIPFSVGVLEEWRARHGNRDNLLDAMDDDLDELLADAARYAPIFLKVPKKI